MKRINYGITKVEKNFQNFNIFNEIKLTSTRFIMIGLIGMVTIFLFFVNDELQFRHLRQCNDYCIGLIEKGNFILINGVFFASDVIFKYVSCV